MRVSWITLIALMALLIVSMSCASGQPVPYGDETLILSIGSQQLHADGDQAKVSVTMLKADGMPVLDNTRVLLKSTAGYFLDPELQLIDGHGETTFFTDSFVGDVVISASSGSVGADGSVSSTITVVESDNAPASIVAISSPSTVSEKGDIVKLTAYVYNSTGQTLKDKSVFFATDLGTLGSNGFPVTTNAQGSAEDTLVVNQSLNDTTAITVTISCVDQSAELSIQVRANQAPVADFSVSPSSPSISDQISFINKSTDPDGQIEFQSWNFGDGTGSSDINPVHTYTAPGNYLVSLTVEDNAGTTSYAEKTVNVTSGELPVPDFSYTPNPVRVGTATVLDASLSADADGSIVNYEWNFGAGFVRQGVQTTWVFNSSGSASVTLRVTDNAGNRVALTKELQIEGNKAPIPQIKYSPTSPRQGETVQFYGDESHDEDGSIADYTWNFADGGSSHMENPTHVFSQSGDYLVQLKVQDNQGGIGITSASLNISDNQVPTASFYITPQSPKAGQIIQFNGSESADSDGTINNYAWDFGDGSQGNSQIATHTYQDAGSYIALLTVTDNDGGKGTQQKSIVISEQQNNPPQIILVASPSTVTVSTAEVLLDASSTTDDHTSLLGLTFTFSATPIETTGGIQPLTVSLVNTGNDFSKKLHISGAEVGDLINIVLTVIDSEGAYSVKSMNLEVSGP